MAAKTIFRLMAIIIIACSLSVSTASAQQPTPTTPDKIQPASQYAPELESLVANGAGDEQVLNQIDQLVDNNWSNLISKQSDYRQTGNGKYWQGRASHSTPPANGQNHYPDKWFDHPSDQQSRWADSGMIGYSPMPYELEFSVYDGPEGAGWVACYRVRLTGGLYEKCRNYGPETLRGHDWQVIP